MDVHQSLRNNRALLTSSPSPRRINLFGAFLFCFTFYSAKRSWLGDFRVSFYSLQTDAQRAKRRWQFFCLKKCQWAYFFFATYYARYRWIVHGYCTKAKRRSLNHGYRHLYVYRGAFMVRRPPSFVQAVILPLLKFYDAATIQSHRKTPVITRSAITPSFVKVSKAVVIVF